MESLGAMWTEARQFLCDLDRFALQPQLLICVSQIPPAMGASSHSGVEMTYQLDHSLSISCLLGGLPMLCNNGHYIHIECNAIYHQGVLHIGGGKLHPKFYLMQFPILAFGNGLCYPTLVRNLGLDSKIDEPETQQSLH